MQHNDDDGGGGGGGGDLQDCGMMVPGRIISFKEEMQISMATQRVLTTWHSHIEKSLEILINPNSYWPTVVREMME